ncbi:c-type cytochrome biogenesis protein CcsB [Desertivirga arenae]|uniref:c-type cytochrome biogenesis protein CcsB n=1 Tax=Desertivirga arenae TaxID=2810309 RepID=UPI001F604171|nr:c-type cytochrome biogenesis protein CcsB [Pedobacter sp. SYSU D00823]
MISKSINILFSTRTMGTLLLFYAFSMALATFVENDYGTAVAKQLIYNCWWFELVMVLLILNFVGNIKRYQLLSVKKLPLLVFHLAFIIIFIGGFITRYISFEGTMHIREGNASNEVVSEATFFKVQIGLNEHALAYDDVPVILLSNRIPWYLKPFHKSFVSEYDYKGSRVKMRVVDFYPRAQDSLVLNPSGTPTLHLVVLENGKRVNKYIPSGSVKLIQDMIISYNKPTPGAINIAEGVSGYTISSPSQGSYMIMATQERKAVVAGDKLQDFHLRSLYQFGNLAFVVPQPAKPGTIIYFEGDKRANEHDLDFLRVEVTTPKAIDTVSFYGGRGMTDFQSQSEIGGLPISMAYGSRVYLAPFFLKLTDFKMEKYPGSNSPAAYSSDILIQNGQTDRPYKIFMNHVLDEQGYRFFQSSYDPDELGTILSVNHDFWGTRITYIGYALLFIGLFVTLFWKGSHFYKLGQQLKDLSRSKATLVLLLFLPFAGQSQEIDMHGKEPGQHDHSQHDHSDHDHSQHNHAPAEDSSSRAAAAEAPDHDHAAAIQQLLAGQMLDAKTFANSVLIDKVHADNFGRLLVQNIDGRIEPVNTMALEILRRLYQKDNFYNLSANQFFLSMSARPFDWVNVPLIRVGTKGGPGLSETVEANKEGYTSMVNLLAQTADGGVDFKLKDEYLKSFAKKPSEQNGYDKDIIDLNDKLQVMQQLLNGQYLRVFPVAGDKNNTWSAPQAPVANTPAQKNEAVDYMISVNNAIEAGNWNEANQKLTALKQIQLQLGKDIIPSAAKVEMEVRYNSWNIFLKLMIAYALLGTVILALAFGRLFSDSTALSKAVKFLLIIISIAAFLQMFGLGVRWYISGHEPWSNGYEAVMFISWIGVMSGLLLYRNSNAFIPAAGCLIAVILMGFAHGGSQMNPQITPLVPVLKSYWLMVHVAIITSSYGFFGLSALLGTVVLVLYIIDHKKIAKKVASSVLELTIVNEMSLTVGIFLLTVGTFLGGIWANESWGRYWSWDPKETWAFISVIVYAFVLHIRLIPGMRGKYLFNLLSLLAFSVIIMTYFGVNYYLTGLHSYAQGDPVPIPSWVYITVSIVAILAIVSYQRYKNKPVIVQKTVAPLKSKRK